MIKIHPIHIWKKLIKHDFFFFYFTCFADLLTEQSKFFVQQIFAQHIFQDNAVKFLISSFLAASRACMMQTLEVIFLASKDNYVIKFYLLQYISV